MSLILRTSTVQGIATPHAGSPQPQSLKTEDFPDCVDTALKAYKQGLLDQYYIDNGKQTVTYEKIPALIKQGFSLRLCENGRFYLTRGLPGGSPVAELVAKLDAKPVNQRSVFISYQWNHSNVADEIQKAFEGKGFLVIRDKKDLSHGNSLKGFMELINHPNLNYVVTVISDSYLKSENCMFEVSQIVQKFKLFKNFLLAYVVSEDQNEKAQIYKDADRQKYIDYWKNTSGSAKGDKIANDLSHFLSAVADKINPAEKELRGSRYQPFFNIIADNESTNNPAIAQSLRGSHSISHPAWPAPQMSNNDDDNAAALTYINTMKEQLGSGFLEKLRETNQKLSELLTTRERLTLAYSAAEGLETLVLHKHFGQLDSTLKAELLANLNRCLLLGLVQSGGTKHIMSQDFLEQLKRRMLPTDTLPMLRAEQSATTALVQLVQAGTQEIMNWASLMQKLIASSDKQEQAEILATVQKYWIPLMYALTFFGVGKQPAVIDWIQKQLQKTDPSPQERFMSLYYLVTIAESAALFVSEQILLGDEEAIGLRHWLKGKDKDDMQLFYNLCTKRQEPLWKELLRDMQLSTFSLSQTLQNLAQKCPPHSKEKIDSLLLYQRLQKLENIPLPWTHYCSLGEAYETVDPQLALSAYQQADELVKKTNEDSSVVKNRLSGLHVKQGKQLITEGKKVEGLRHLLQALSQWDDTQTSNMLQPYTSQLLYNTCLPNNDIAERLSQVMRPLGKGEKEAELLAQGCAIVTPLFSGRGVLSADAVNQLFEKDHLRIANYREGTNSIKQGRHNVAIIGKAPRQLHLKENPGCPGLAFGAYALYQLSYGLTGEAKPGLVPILPLKVERMHEGKLQTYYLQASPTVYGKNLHELRKAALPPEKSQVSAMIMGSMLLDPEDGRADNFILSDNGQIICIDNDHVWVKEDVEKGLMGNIRPVVKNILYCFPEMQEEIDPALRKQLTSDAFQPLEMLKLWLYTLEHYNNALEAVYSPDERKKLYERPNEDEKIILDAYFNPEAIGRLYLKWSMLRRALRDPACKTHMDLLKAVQPRLAEIYRGAFQQRALVGPFQRFDSVTSGCFTPQGGTQTTNSKLVQQILGKSIANYREFAAARTLPQDLLRLLKDVHHDSHLIKFIANDLQTGRLSLFRDLPEMQSLVLRSFSFKEIRPEIYTPALHQEFLQAISPNTEELILHDNPLLTDEELVLLIERLPKLKKLELTGCPQIRGKAVALSDGFFSKRTFESFVQALEQKEMTSITIKNCMNISVEPILYMATGNSKIDFKHDEKFLPLIKAVAEVQQTPSKFIEASKVLNTEDGMMAFVKAFAFGKDKWEKYFGVIDEAVPELPRDIVAILCSEDPYNTGKKVAETHMLVLVPTKVNGKPLNLLSFQELVKKPKEGASTKYKNDIADCNAMKTYGTRQPARAQWVLMTKDVIPGSSWRTIYKDQVALVRAKSHYDVPDLMSAVVAILSHCVRTGECLFQGKCIYCQETTKGTFWYEADSRVIVGNLWRSDLSPYYVQEKYAGLFIFSTQTVGGGTWEHVAAMRKF